MKKPFSPNASVKLFGFFGLYLMDMKFQEILGYFKGYQRVFGEYEGFRDQGNSILCEF